MNTTFLQQSQKLLTDKYSLKIFPEKIVDSDDSIVDKDFVPERSSSVAESEESEISETDDSMYSSDDDVPLVNLIKWKPVGGDRNTFDVTPKNTCVNPIVAISLAGKDPVDFFNHFLDDEIILLFVTETNRFAAQNIAAATNHAQKARLIKWVDTNPSEIRKFLGMIMWMGLLQIPKLRDYWSTCMLYQNAMPKIMSRNGFELILGIHHVCNNEEQIQPGNRLFKVSKFLNMLQTKFQQSYTPEEVVCIDESNIPFRGRLSFRQYIPNKKAQVISQQNNDKTVVLKWKDKRDVLMLSTKHDDSMTTFTKKGKQCKKPTMVLDYNKGKGFIHLSDQMAAYAPYVRRTVKWYKRLLFRLISATTVINATYLFNKVNNKKLNITKFKESLVLSLLKSEVSIPGPSTSRGSLRQRLANVPEALKAKAELIDLLGDSRFQLHKWSNNSLEVVQSKPIDQSGKRLDNNFRYAIKYSVGSNKIMMGEDDDTQEIYSSGESEEEEQSEAESECLENMENITDIDESDMENDGGALPNNFNRAFLPTWEPVIHNFTEDNLSGVKNENITQNSSILEVFETFFTNTLQAEEFICFIGITLLMSRVKKFKFHDYWSTNPLLSTPIFGKIMKRDRYYFILKMMHFCDSNNPNAADKLIKIRMVVDSLKSTLGENFYPYRNICIDESSLLFKGRLHFKQYIPSKRRRFGVKLFLNCDCKTGFVLNFIIYTGTTTDLLPDDFNLGKSGQVVLTLLEKYLNKGHVLYIDNWYTSSSLFLHLHNNQINATGTVKHNRRYMPVLKEKLNKGEMMFKSAGPILTIKWCDKRDIYMLSTNDEIGMAEIEKKIDRLELIQEIFEKYKMPTQLQSRGTASNVLHPTRLTERHFISKLPQVRGHRHAVRRRMVCSKNNRTGDMLSPVLLPYHHESPCEPRTAGMLMKNAYPDAKGLSDQCTKRTILSDLAKLFDPLGLLAQLQEEAENLFSDSGSEYALLEDSDLYVDESSSDASGNEDLNETLYSDGVAVTKWRDKRDALVLSTEFPAENVEIERARGENQIKPKAVVMYNKYVSGIDRQDQMLTYYPCKRKTIR
ncbi:hypothetical protein NQ314_018955 [Rhamnusium bicolor]|uniref:PiggyBac transposable element-derived protein domain-containing protein n=1 Tax=Rhamnusium bicolor TaxID=1586634 RepID=A0AAV8WQB7_9CUCU|nr:hypothetical protein NQ314_018955 [Rhamnusium bicolor]